MFVFAKPHFGNLATATRILWCPSPAGARAAAGGNPLYIMITSSTAQGGDGNFKNRKPIEEVGCWELGMAERNH